jgi:hypothetical protein
MNSVLKGVRGLGILEPCWHLFYLSRSAFFSSVPNVLWRVSNSESSIYHYFNYWRLCMYIDTIEFA